MTKKLDSRKSRKLYAESDKDCLMSHLLFHSGWGAYQCVRCEKRYTLNRDRVSELLAQKGKK